MSTNRSKVPFTVGWKFYVPMRDNLLSLLGAIRKTFLSVWITLLSDQPFTILSRSTAIPCVHWRWKAAQLPFLRAKKDQFLCILGTQGNKIANWGQQSLGHCSDCRQNSDAQTMKAQTGRNVFELGGSMSRNVFCKKCITWTSTD